MRKRKRQQDHNNQDQRQTAQTHNKSNTKNNKNNNTRKRRNRKKKNEGGRINKYVGVGILLAGVVLVVVSAVVLDYVFFVPEQAFDYSIVPHQALSLSPQQIEHFEKEGYLVVKGAVLPSLIDHLRHHNRRFPSCYFTCTFAWAVFLTTGRSIGNLGNIWVTSDVVYNFVKNSHVADLVAQVSRADTVRLIRDQPIFVSQSKNVVTHRYHFDAFSFSNVHPNSTGYSVWIPYNDIDSSVGGSLEIVPHSKVSQDCSKHMQQNPYDSHSPACSELGNGSIFMDFSRGDILLFDDHLVHRSQLFTDPSREREAMILRFVDGSARYRNKNFYFGSYCASGLVDNDPFLSPCYPQIYPNVIPAEENARSQHLLDFGNPDWLVLLEFARMLQLLLS